ncbi:hypothetical protein ACL02T_02795 [Pseudonocardia sp. RS010]|uniref:hypothetical protein n=1 Tax=Pseudonocardia sp. RS010 TaxID=3385979 RepID=UPI0039A10C51
MARVDEVPDRATVDRATVDRATVDWATVDWATVEGTLAACAADTPRGPWAVHVGGRPGGLVRLHGDRIVGVWTSGTPLASPSPGRRPGRTATSLAAAAVADALYVMAAGRVRAVRAEAGPPDDLPGPGLALGRALPEVRRRLAVVARSGRAVPPEETRPRLVGSRVRALLTAGEEAVCGLADGGLTLRDIAFLVDRPVFGVVVDALYGAGAGVLELDVCATPEPERPVTPPVTVPGQRAIGTIGPPSIRPPERRVVSLLARRRARPVTAAAGDTVSEARSAGPGTRS